MIDERLLGRWRTLPETTDEPVTMELDEHGSLTYTMHGAERDQKMFLRYRTEGDVIVSDQPSDPREERTTYRLTAEGLLVLIYDGEEWYYQRCG